jgi:hypothetical protein
LCRIGGEGHLSERHGAVRAGDGEFAVGELDIGLSSLEQMGGDLLAFGDDLVHGLDQRGTAHRKRARRVGPHAEGHLASVAVNDVDHLEGEAEAIDHELGEGSLVALAVAVRAGEDGDAAGGVGAHFRRLVEAGTRAELARHHRGCHGAGLNIGADADTAQLAAFRGLLPSLLEAGVIGSFHRPVK